MAFSFSLLFPKTFQKGYLSSHQTVLKDLLDSHPPACMAESEMVGPSSIS